MLPAVPSIHFWRGHYGCTAVQVGDDGVATPGARWAASVVGRTGLGTERRPEGRTGPEKKEGFWIFSNFRIRKKKERKKKGKGKRGKRKERGRFNKIGFAKNNILSFSKNAR